MSFWLLVGRFWPLGALPFGNARRSVWTGLAGCRACRFGKTGLIDRRCPHRGASLELGRIELARFSNPSGLTSLGENLFVETAASGEAIRGFAQDEGMGRIAQGYLEASNVEIVQEMVDMITAMRAYEINSKAIKTSEDMSQVANSLVR